MGYDVLVGYLPSIQRFPDIAVLRLFGWIWAPLGLCLVWVLSFLSFGQIYLFLKVFGPILYGCFAVSFYRLVRTGLHFREKESFVVSLVFLMQPAVLRIGWDQFREELGLAFFFLLLAQISCDFIEGSRKKPWLVLGLALTIVLSQEIVSVLLFVVVSWQVASSLSARQNVTRTLAVVSPALSVFVAQVYGEFIDFPAFGNNLKPIEALAPVRISNYLAGPPFGANDYVSLVVALGSLSIYVLIPMLPLSVLGYFKDRVFLPLVIWLLIASFDIVVVPLFGIPYFWWWLFLLPIPLTVYSGRALEKLNVLNVTKRFGAGLVLLALLAVVSVGYCTSMINLGYPNAYAYMPSSLVGSAVMYSDISSIQQALSWCNQNVPANSLLIVPENFEGFASIDSRADLIVRVAPPTFNLANALNGYSISGLAFAAYYVDDVGNAPVQLITSFGNIGVYRVTYSA